MEAIARDFERIAESLAGNADLHEVIQRMEMILEMQRDTMQKAEKQRTDK